jgi:hypothetical protein
VVGGVTADPVGFVADLPDHVVLDEVQPALAPLTTKSEAARIKPLRVT